MVRRRGRRGLTLVEAMVAIAILLVMSLVVAESLRNSIEFHNLLSNRDGTVRTARVVLSKLKRDLQLSYLSPNRTQPQRFLTVFVGLDEEPDKLYFATLNHQRLYLNSREADLAEVTVWAESSKEGPGYTLYHREAPRIDGEPDEQGVVWPLARNVRSFSLRFLDQQSGEWREEWDSRGADTPYRLPRAVEIALVLIAPDPEDPTGERTVDVPFLTTVVVEYAPRMPNPNDPLSNLGGAAGGGNTAGVNGLAGGGVGGVGGVGGIGGGGGFGGAGAGGLGFGNVGGGVFSSPTGRGGRGARAGGARPRSTPAAPRTGLGGRP
ncbi:MAG: GspJ family type II secretion system protein [Myxococcales bacterium]|nr:GspJ family type II secretion system protein [Myxococcales bacterium]